MGRWPPYNGDLPEELTLDLNLKVQKTLSSREGKGENVRQKEKHVKKHQEVNKCGIVQRLVLVDTCSIALVNQLAVVYPETPRSALPHPAETQYPCLHLVPVLGPTHYLKQQPPG